MSQDSVMPKIDVNKELNGSAQLNYMKLMEKENMERVRKLKRIRHRNLLTGLLLTGGVFSICILFAGSSFPSKFPRVLNEKRTDLNFFFY
uniref:Putative cytochrome c oxidase assembly protein 3 mitochondrial n=1 Tax=Ixodes ricinus TaxID=34613 RepID=A0A6B0U0H1_IXORI